MGFRIEARRGKNIAKVASACKLLTLVYYRLRGGHIGLADDMRGFFSDFIVPRSSTWCAGRSRADVVGYPATEAD
jgi:hypothetical protein